MTITDEGTTYGPSSRRDEVVVSSERSTMKPGYYYNYVECLARMNPPGSVLID